MDCSLCFRDHDKPVHFRVLSVQQTPAWSSFIEITGKQKNLFYYPTVHCGDLRLLKFAESTGANGDERLRAPDGQPLTQAQHFMHFAGSDERQSSLTASAGHTEKHFPHPLQSIGSISGTSLTGFTFCPSE